MQLFWVDAFTDKIFSGNPAGVVPLEAWPEDRLMQRIAFENGLAETAFFVRTGPARFHLRWFTPTVEVDLCGHATLASAFVVFNHLGQSGDQITFDSRSGPLIVARRGELLELDFPATPPREEPDPTLRASVSEALGGARVSWLGRSIFDLLAVLPDAAAVRAIAPDMVRIAALGGRGLIATATGDESADFVSRFFGPQAGVPEDPVTGSAHCALAPFWAARLGKTRLHARQVSARGGELLCELAGDRVRMAGSAVLYLRGELAF
jgi:PhzF family phenazine biosynthesis protein